ncbi:unnamed protein product, partial [Amoebophrya sp. A25]
HLREQPTLTSGFFMGILLAALLCVYYYEVSKTHAAKHKGVTHNEWHRIHMLRV